MHRCSATLFASLLLTVTTSSAEPAGETLGDLLEKWSQNAAADSFDLQVIERELDPNGQWVTEKPVPGRFRYDRQRGSAQWDRLTTPATSWTLEGNTLTKQAQGKEKTSQTLAPNDLLPARLWIDELPAFLLVGIDSPTLTRDYEIRSFRRTDREVQLYFYPQRQSLKNRFQRLEVRLSSTLYVPVEIHILWKDNRHTFYAIVDPNHEKVASPPKAN